MFAERATTAIADTGGQAVDALAAVPLLAAALVAALALVFYEVVTASATER